MRKMILGFALVLAGCQADGATTAPTASIPNAPHFDFNSSAPAPAAVSASVVGRVDNASVMVRVLFLDTANDEGFVSAYFTPDASFTNSTTLTISGTAGQGNREVDLQAPATATTLRLRYAWLGGSSGLIWGPFSDAATITIAGNQAPVRTKGSKK